MSLFLSSSMTSKSCLNICKCASDDFESVKSCFSYDDWIVLKRHPEIDFTLNSLKKSHQYRSENNDIIFNLNYEYESLRKIKLENGNNNGYPNDEPNYEKCLKFNTKSASKLGRSNYEFLSPYQKKLKEQKQLQSELINFENTIQERMLELKTIDDLLQSDLNALHLKKLKLLQEINEKVNSVTDKIIKIKNKKLIVRQNIVDLNKKLEEIDEMTKLKEIKICEFYLKIHQKGRQAFDFSKKSEMSEESFCSKGSSKVPNDDESTETTKNHHRNNTTSDTDRQKVISSLDLSKNSESYLQLDQLQKALKELRSKTEDLKNAKLKDNYSNYPLYLEFSTDFYLVKMVRDCLFYYLTSKSNEESIISLRAMINILPYNNAIKDSLLEKINK